MSDGGRTAENEKGNEARGTLQAQQQSVTEPVFPANPQSIDEAERAATLQIFAATNQAHKEAVTQAVEEAEEIHNDQVLLFHSPFLQESIRRLDRHLLTQQDTAISHIERIANEYRSRIHI